MKKDSVDNFSPRPRILVNRGKLVAPSLNILRSIKLLSISNIFIKMRKKDSADNFSPRPQIHEPRLTCLAFMIFVLNQKVKSTFNTSNFIFLRLHAPNIFKLNITFSYKHFFLKSINTQKRQELRKL